ncbi:MAG TPA: 2-C-methyl-D-erythritol 4-phosphate cytidylyltransferase [Micromonosporaceae bacterium]|nr:2-C-methyl-D-erythritol 4-phosphate cytidylyltransferase [Micromonosporaceae bacterium]
MTAQTDARGDVAILVPAAGMGVRMGPGGPKALRLLAGEPLLLHAVRGVAAAACVGLIVVAAPAPDVDAVAALLETIGCPIRVVPGGSTRQASVASALAAVPAEFDLVLVHDAARALAPASLIESVAAKLRAGSSAVVPALPVADTIKRVGFDGEVVATVDRSVLRAVQTPQGFRRATLAAAHASAADDHTDDAGLAEQAGVQVDTVPGDDLAFKITRPFDLAVAEALLASGVAERRPVR